MGYLASQKSLDNQPTKLLNMCTENFLGLEVKPKITHPHRILLLGVLVASVLLAWQLTRLRDRTAKLEQQRKALSAEIVQFASETNDFQLRATRAVKIITQEPRQRALTTVAARPVNPH